MSTWTPVASLGNTSVPNLIFWISAFFSRFNMSVLRVASIDVFVELSTAVIVAVALHLHVFRVPFACVGPGGVFGLPFSLLRRLLRSRLFLAVFHTGLLLRHLAPEDPPFVPVVIWVGFLA